jgi:hypothetical protein
MLNLERNFEAGKRVTMDIDAVATAQYLWISGSDRLGVGSMSFGTPKYREMDA